MLSTNMKRLCLFVLTLLLFATLITLAAIINAEPYKLSIIHINDFHARFEPTDRSGGTCEHNETCIGGYARTVYTVRRLLDENKNKNVLYLNAGDNFQGTLWYNIGRWNVTSEFLNLLPADAMTLGNHEFDHGVAGVVPFLETLNSPMLVANMDVKNEPTMEGKFNKSMIIERGNRKIGVIGIILETTYDLANTGKLIFLNESEAIREEAQKLKAQGANIIIAITHCGYEVDKLIARTVGDEIDVIIGSHSHTFLYTGDNPPGPDKPRGDYPTVVTHESGHRVLIVQAAAYARYVGYIEISFDDAGNVLDWNGAPIYMNTTVPEDPQVLAAMQPWKEIIDVQGNVPIGETVVNLLKEPCSYTECNLGNFFNDAMIHAFAKISPHDSESWTMAAISIVNSGAIRVPLYKGNLSYSHLVTMSPFENIMVAFNLRGDKLLEALEYSVQPIDLAAGLNTSFTFLQFSGLKVTFDLTKPVGSRVADVRVRCAKCKVPAFEKINTRVNYRIITPDFLMKGGDGFHMFRDYATDLEHKMTDIDALIDYTKTMSPIYTGLDGRITCITK